MEFSTKRVGALIKKELKDFTKNMNISTMCLLPLIFSFIYGKVFAGHIYETAAKLQMLGMCLGMSLTLISSFVIAMLIAEEKEKNTLRTLMLSGISPAEFIFGKAFIAFLSSTIINIIIFFIFGMEVKHLGIYILVSTLVNLSMIAIGGVIGILAENQMSTGIIGMPVIFILLLVPALANLNDTLEAIAKFLPNYNMNVLLGNALNGNLFEGGVLFPIAVILAWIVLSLGAFAYAYKAKGLDN